MTHNDMSIAAQRMEAIITTMADGIIVTDEAGQVVLFNKASEEIFEIKSSDVLDRSLQTLDIHPELPRMVQETLTTGRLVRKDLHLIVNQRDIWLNAYSSPVRDQSSVIKGSVVVLHDLTEIYKSEKAQKEFVGNVSHELRTPITAVRVTAEALLSGAKDDPNLLNRFLTTLVKESERLSLLIDDLLDITKRDAGMRRLRKSDFYLQEVVSRVIAMHKAQAGNDQIEMIMEIPNDLSIYADELQIEQVLENLVDNAVKYSLPQGKVTVKAIENSSSVVIDVSDTGIGIPNEEVLRIFERFYRVDKARSRQHGGTGLGLSIVKDIIDAHNGTITVETELGTGSTFTITLPKDAS